MANGSFLNVASDSRPASATIAGLVPASAFPAMADEGRQWETQLTQRLCGKYLEACPRDEAVDQRARALKQIATSLGGTLVSSGTSAVPVEDIAALALLLSRKAEADRPGTASETKSSDLGQDAEAPSAQDAQGIESQPASAVTDAADDADTGFADIAKG